MLKWKFNTKWFLAILVFGVVVFVWDCSAHAAGRIVPQGEVVEVEYVRTIDGDTIEVIMDGETVSVRLFAVDAPELEEGTRDAFFVACAVATLLEGSTALWVEIDPDHQLDRWGRQLGWVWYEHESQPGQPGMLNLEMLWDDAFSVTYYPGCQSHYYDQWIIDRPR